VAMAVAGATPGTRRDGGIGLASSPTGSGVAAAVAGAGAPGDGGEGDSWGGASAGGGGSDGNSTPSDGPGVSGCGTLSSPRRVARMARSSASVTPWARR